MQLRNEFTVSVPVEQAWSVLTDVERVAPCIPGAELQEVEGEEYRGIVKLKVGPITTQYRGHARFLKQDAASRQAVMRAEGRETRGQGNASATIVATLEGAGEGTRVTIETDLTVTGRVAQFGRGVLAEVSNKLVSQFVESLEATVLSGPQPTRTPEAMGSEQSAPGANAAGSSRAAASESVDGSDAAEGAASQPDGPGAARPESGTVGRATSAPPNGGVDARTPAKGPELNLLALVGPALVKRLVPVFVGIALVALVWRRRATRSGRSAT